MKTIKFRTFDTKAKKWLTEIPPRECMLDSKDWDHVGDEYLMHYPANPLRTFDGRLVHQLFTGLTDKNSLELFEGDLCRLDESHIACCLPVPALPKFTKGLIEWSRQSFIITQPVIGWAYLGEFSTCQCCFCGLEKIGTIYDENQNYD